MHIIQLSAENVKKLKAIRVTPEGNVVKVTGANAAGKTSVLDCIWMALGGGPAIPDQPIRNGAETATIQVMFDDFVVNRRITPGGSTLTIENSDGAVFKSPQTMLNNLIGKLTFDPLQFISQHPSEQFNELKNLVELPIDLDDLASRRQAAYEARTEINRKGKAKAEEYKSIVFSMPEDEIPLNPVSIESLVQQLNSANESNKVVGSIQHYISSTQSEIKDIESEILDLQTRISELNQSLQEKNQKLSDLKTRLSNSTVIDTDHLSKQISKADKINSIVREKARKDALAKELDNLRDESRELSEEIKVIDDGKANALSKAQFPVEGLSFGDGIVLFNNLPLDQASSAEQLKVSMAIAMQANPKIRVIRITDASLLDSSSMAVIEQMAKENDFQVWMEIVDETGKVGVYIEDGEIVSVNGEQQ